MSDNPEAASAATAWPAAVAALAERMVGQAAVGRAIGVRRDVVWRWVSGANAPTGLYARELRRLMGEHGVVAPGGQ